MSTSRSDVVVLLDSDEVLGRFHEPAIKVAEKIAGREFPIHLFTSWDIFDVIPKKFKKKCFAQYSAEGFCRSLAPYEDAVRGVRELLKITPQVHVVTSPMWDSKVWMYERTKWVTKHFGIPRHHVTHTEAKHLVFGHVLVEDKAANLRKWSERHPGGDALLIDRPFNRLETGLRRVHNWDEIIDVVRTQADGLSRI